MNRGFTYRERIAAASQGQPVHAYLSGRYSHSSPARWREHLEAGRVTLDGRVADAEELLKAGQRLTYHRPPWEEEPVPTDTPVLYDQGGVLVVHKPAGLPTQAGGGFLEHTLVHLMGQRGASPIHRLGRWTSGAVICGRDPATLAHLSRQLRARTLTKRYRALATGRPERAAFDIDQPIGPVPYPPLGTVHGASRDGRPALSHVRVVEQRPQAFLADVLISTGRPHQIRVHLASVGHALVGDPLYGTGGLPLDGGSALPGDPGYSLHAAEVAFEHPESGVRVHVLAPDAAPLLRSHSY